MIAKLLCFCYPGSFKKYLFFTQPIHNAFQILLNVEAQLPY